MFPQSSFFCTFTLGGLGLFAYSRLGDGGDWHKGLLLDERLNKEKLINNFKNDTFWLIELLPDSSKKFSMSICNKCGARQDNLSEPNFDDEYSCICSEGFIISKSFTENKKILFSNNNESYASDSVRVIGRLVQVVKEI